MKKSQAKQGQQKLSKLLSHISSNHVSGSLPALQAKYIAEYQSRPQHEIKAHLTMWQRAKKNIRTYTLTRQVIYAHYVVKRVYEEHPEYLTNMAEDILQEERDEKGRMQLTSVGSAAFIATKLPQGELRDRLVISLREAD